MIIYVYDYNIYIYIHDYTCRSRCRIYGQLAGVTFTVKDRHTCVSPVAYHALKHAKQAPLPKSGSGGSLFPFFCDMRYECGENHITMEHHHVFMGKLTKFIVIDIIGKGKTIGKPWKTII